MGFPKHPYFQGPCKIFGPEEWMCADSMYKPEMWSVVLFKKAHQWAAYCRSENIQILGLKGIMHQHQMTQTYHHVGMSLHNSTQPHNFNEQWRECLVRTGLDHEHSAGDDTNEEKEPRDALEQVQHDLRCPDSASDSS